MPPLGWLVRVCMLMTLIKEPVVHEVKQCEASLLRQP